MYNKDNVVMDSRINHRKRKYSGLVNSHTVLRSCNDEKRLYLSKCSSSGELENQKKVFCNNNKKEPMNSSIWFTSQHECDLPHPSHIRKRKGGRYGRRHEKNVNNVDSYIKQIKLKQAHFSWSSLSDVRDELPYISSEEATDSNSLLSTQYLLRDDENKTAAGFPMYEEKCSQQSSYILENSQFNSSTVRNKNELDYSYNDGIAMYRYNNMSDEVLEYSSQVVPTTDHPLSNHHSYIASEESLHNVYEKYRKPENVNKRSLTPSVPTSYEFQCNFNDVIAVRTDQGDIMTVLSKNNETMNMAEMIGNKSTKSRSWSHFHKENKFERIPDISLSSPGFEMFNRVVNSNHRPTSSNSHSNLTCVSDEKPPLFDSRTGRLSLNKTNNHGVVHASLNTRSHSSQDKITDSQPSSKNSVTETSISCDSNSHFPNVDRVDVKHGRDYTTTVSKNTESVNSVTETSISYGDSHLQNVDQVDLKHGRDYTMTMSPNTESVNSVTETSVPFTGDTHLQNVDHDDLKHGRDYTMTVSTTTESVNSSCRDDDEELDLPEDILALNSIVEFINDNPEKFKQFGRRKDARCD